MVVNLKEGEYLGRTIKASKSSFFNLSITNYTANCYVEKHYHDNNYISVLIQGNYLEKNSRNEQLILPGNIVFRPSGYFHENLFNYCGGLCFNIEFVSKWQEGFDNALKLPNSIANYKTGSFPSIYKLLLNFQHSYDESLAHEFIYDWLFQTNQKSFVIRNQPWIEKIATIIENELDCFHTIQSLSERVFVHPVYLARGFKEKKGITIGEYQLKVKLANSISLLLNSSLQIKEIACKNGFFDDAHFIRAFKSVYKISPLQFRLSAKKLI